MKKIIRLGTRGSPLALLQAEEARRSIFQHNHGLDREVEIEIVPMRTSGDWQPQHKEQTFRDIGAGKELFTKEIDEALIEGHIDLAVHSMKDVPSVLPDQLTITATLQRADVQDAFIGRDVKTLEELPKGAIVGTASLRRHAQLLAYRPDLKIVSIRGNVETRLRKLSEGLADATILAMAGLKRLGMEDRAGSVISTDVMLPAAAQGAIAIETRKDDADIVPMVANANHMASWHAVIAERAFLRVLDGSCHTPIGALAHSVGDGGLRLRGMAARPNGSQITRLEIVGKTDEAESLGGQLALQMKQALPPNFFAA
ncbi:MAG: hydroxymethylbilane synthase [Alphaproteobacteria bacterium]|nr:hydroxymethylbilane synthase [Alphaproteobacteria bacterium]MBV8548558.1 hydroxymethylbilane synthase [Alphaproteobacteria bacterium]